MKVYIVATEEYFGGIETKYMKAFLNKKDAEDYAKSFVSKNLEVQIYETECE